MHSLYGGTSVIIIMDPQRIIKESVKQEMYKRLKSIQLQTIKNTENHVQYFNSAFTDTVAGLLFKIT